jgi:hypothetical protein
VKNVLKAYTNTPTAFPSWWYQHKTAELSKKAKMFQIPVQLKKI